MVTSHVGDKFTAQEALTFLEEAQDRTIAFDE